MRVVASVVVLVGLCSHQAAPNEAVSRVKRQFEFSIGLPNNNNNNEGRQDFFGNVLNSFFNPNQNQRPGQNNGNNAAVNPFDLFNNLGGNQGNNVPSINPNNQNTSPVTNSNNNSNVLGTINFGNIPIHLTGNPNGGLGVSIGGGNQAQAQNACGDQGRHCQQGCRAVRRRYRCYCNQGYFLNRDRRTCSDIDECRGTNGGCFGTCVNNPGSYKCACPSHLTLQSDGRTCLQGGGSTGGTVSCNVDNGGCSQGCSPNNFGVTCFCHQGFTIGQDHKSCEKQDLCKQNNGGCQQTCSLTPSGGVQCSCPTGQVLQQDGRSCRAPPSATVSCSFNNGGCHHFCNNIQGGRSCFCNRGFELQPDGVSCNVPQLNQICSNNNGGCQQLCQQNIFGAQCGCKNGFQLKRDRKNCQDFDECTFNNGGCQSVCTNTEGSRTCSCPAGTTLRPDGVSCAVSQTASCAGNNGGCSHICNVAGNVVSCSCRPGHVLGGDRKTCGDVNECQNRNGGCEHVCTNTQGSFACSCRSGFNLVNGKCVGITAPAPAPAPAPGPSPVQKKGCGVNGKKSLFRRIVGGKPADPKDWPWMAALLQATGDVQYCGGTLITDRHVLTAAHCMKPFSASQIKIRLGEYNFDTFDDNNPTDFNVLEIRMHENYDSQTQENDIAILKMDRSTSFSEFIWPICLPEVGTNYEGNRGYVTGWGTIHFGGPVATTLQEVIVPVWTQAECEAAYPKKIFAGMMCAGLKEGGKDSCQGDSGGPFQTQDGRTLRWEVSGVVSWGVECASANRPGVYTKVNDYIGWIKTNSVFP